MPAKYQATGDPEVVEGVLDRIVFAAEETGWSVVRVRVSGRPDPIAVVGNLPGVQAGESLRVVGRWTVDTKYGEQFRADTYTSVRPATLVGIEKYLGSGLVPGIGPKTAKRLVDHFGLSTLEVIELNPNRLTEVPGIGAVRAARMRQAWENQRSIKEVMVFLQSHGVSTTFAIRIFKHYGPRAIEIVRQDPYRLALDIFGIGFKTADAIADKLGVSKDSPRRAQAGVMHILGEATSDGHVYLPRTTLLEAAGKLLDQPAHVIGEAIESLEKAGETVVESDGDSTAVFPRSLYACEVGIADRLRALCVAKPQRDFSVDVAKAAEWFHARSRMALSPGQVDALQLAATRKVLVVTGGPGTGKTTLLQAICAVLGAKGLRLELAAPTGRAARRMSEATGVPSRTLHRLLEFSPNTASFKRNGDNPLEADLVIVDEASMVDAPLCHHLLKAIPLGSRLILVGDADQLPSVGPGCVLADLIASGAVPVTRLTEIFRQAAESLIVMNAHRINQGEMPILPYDAGSDFYFVERESPEEALQSIKELVGVRLPRHLGVHPVRDIQVLSPMNRGLLGAHSLNRELQALLNPEGQTVTRGGREFRVRDKVIQLRNNYEREVFNGDIGVIKEIDEETGTVCVSFDDRELEFDASDLDELALAYACTVHKAQGSEFPVVVVPIHTQHYPMLWRNLLYTAITRGKRMVVLVGTRKALAIAVRRADGQRRLTKLAERLRHRAV
jgi:exodeoxyribonuclease V alpha subunit